MTKISRLPLNDDGNGWSKILPARSPKPALKTHIEADWVVVGGGFAGLAAARRLATHRPNDQIALVEADVIGEGAQGRNSGFAIDVPHNVNSSMGALESARSHTRLSRTAIAYLKTSVDQFNIECDWDPAGKFHAAVSDRGIHHVLEPTRRTLEALGEPYSWLEGPELHDQVGFSHFKAALHTPGTVLVNPAALCRGLADSLPANVTLYENTPVLEYTTKPTIELQTPTGHIHAKKLILTVNAFTGQFGHFKQSVMPFAVHASLTRKLTEQEQARLPGLRQWGLTPANAFAGTTMRRTRDQRILIRQNMQYAPHLRTSDAQRNKVRALHQTLLNQRFPMLQDIPMEFTWTGYIAVSQNGAPGFGQLLPDVYAAVCQNGVGLTRGTIGGMLAADLACGIDNPLIAEFEALGTPQMLPPRPLLDAGAYVRLAWELYRERSEA